ncbi:MAG: adenosylcobalamin-dependent ribonucleoside-diphosphate reductase [Myxococcota bacterium]
MTSPSSNAQRVLESRYLLRDTAGHPLEGWKELCQRVASAVAQAERAHGGEVGPVAEAFQRALLRREFLPNSPTLMNAGTQVGQLSACFVLPVEDSIESIFESVKRMAVIHQSGGGTGFSFSQLRPAGDQVQATRGVASGPVSFVAVFDAATAVVKQGGRRRGANMGVLKVEHPDVLEFVHAKTDPERLTNFNLSVSTPDAFWQAVRGGSTWDLVNPRDGKTVRSVDARSLLDEIAHSAWVGGDPGVLFRDAVEADNPTPELGELAATNPCGELPLLAWESCNLGSIRLDAFVREGRIDWAQLDATVDLGVRFLDDVIEVNRHPYPEIAERTLGNRKIGLGVMGFADLLVDLEIPYDSDAAVALAERVMERIQRRAAAASRALAEERGSFPNQSRARRGTPGDPRRNATVTSIAPTGTLSILAGCSSGIEPLFALAFVRHVLDGQTLPETNKRFERALKDCGAWSRSLVDEVRGTGSVRGIAAVPEAVRRLFPIASDIAPEAHLAVQAAFQRHVDNAVSKTINLPEHATPADVVRIFTRAWRLRLKGVTIFREGSKGMAVLVRGSAGATVQADGAGECGSGVCL